MSYRPITDTWILARAKLKGGKKYYGSYPGGFPERARALLGVTINDPVLHVCGGRIRDYPYKGGCGARDFTLDLDPDLQPDYLQDARYPYPICPLEGHEDGWAAILADPPYTEGDADKYVPGRDVLPSPNLILRHSLDVVRPGGRVGILHYLIPQPPKDVRFVACVGVVVGFNNRGRFYTVFEKPA